MEPTAAAAAEAAVVRVEAAEADAVEIAIADHDASADPARKVLRHRPALVEQRPANVRRVVHGMNADRAKSADPVAKASRHAALEAATSATPAADRTVRAARDTKENPAKNARTETIRTLAERMAKATATQSTPIKIVTREKVRVVLTLQPRPKPQRRINRSAKKSERSSKNSSAAKNQPARSANHCGGSTMRFGVTHDDSVGK